MSAAARGAAGFLYLSGRLLASLQQKAQREAESAAEALKQQREAQLDPVRIRVKRSKFSTAPAGAKRRS